MGKTIVHRSYTNLESLKEHLVEQGSKIEFRFSSTLPDEYIKEINENPTRLKPGCGCTSYSIQTEQNQITFVITAPSFNEKLNEPYLKSVSPIFKSEMGDIIQWDIKFYVI